MSDEKQKSIISGDGVIVTKDGERIPVRDVTVKLPPVLVKDLTAQRVSELIMAQRRMVCSPVVRYHTIPDDCRGTPFEVRTPIRIDPRSQWEMACSEATVEQYADSTFRCLGCDSLVCRHAKAVEWRFLRESRERLRRLELESGLSDSRAISDSIHARAIALMQDQMFHAIMPPEMNVAVTPHQPEPVQPPKHEHPLRPIARVKRAFGGK